MSDASELIVPSRLPLAWFRPSMRKAFLAIWLQAIGFVCLGSLVLGGLRLFAVEDDIHTYWAVPLGMVLIMAGPFWLARRLFRILNEETVLTVERHGLVWHEHNLSYPITWEQLEDVIVTSEALVLRGTHTTLELPKVYNDITAEALAKLLMDLRRKALMGLRLSLPDFAWAQSIRP